VSATTEKRDPSHTSHRERLLDAAAVCLRERGYANTTARDLVRVSRTNLGSIGYHFGSKEALLHEAVARGMDEWTQEVEREAFADEDLPLEQRLRRSMAAMVDRFEELRPFLVAFVEAYPPAVRDEKLREVLAGGYARCRAASEATLEKSLGPDVTPAQCRVLATLVIALVDGLILQFLLDPEAVPSGDEIVDALAATRPRW